MSYESEMLEKYNMPTRGNVEIALLKALLRHGGHIKDFSSGQEIVGELADEFNLSDEQRAVYLESIYMKQNRLKRSSLWHRLLFRAADALAKNDLLSNPTKTAKLINKREWMLMERGFDRALNLLNVSHVKKESLSTRSYEVQKIIKRLSNAKRPENYNPIDIRRRNVGKAKEHLIRLRGFRLAVIETYAFRCAICGLKMLTPDQLNWEVQAAHIVPHSVFGRDDIWNGLALCHLHHWCFDAGWITLDEQYRIQVSPKVVVLPKNYGKIEDFELIRTLASENRQINLPSKSEFYPHSNSIRWHRQNIFYSC